MSTERYLIDTNIFFEILLGRRHAEVCQEFLVINTQKLAISDFALQSLGYTLERQKQIEYFDTFCQQVLPTLEVLSLPKANYISMVSICQNKSLDFDDAYQYICARWFERTLVTLDKDFKKVSGIKTLFLNE